MPAWCPTGHDNFVGIIFVHRRHSSRRGSARPVSIFGRGAATREHRLAASWSGAANLINETPPAAMIVPFGHNAPKSY